MDSEMNELKLTIEIDAFRYITFHNSVDAARIEYDRDREFWRNKNVEIRSAILQDMGGVTIANFAESK